MLEDVVTAMEPGLKAAARGTEEERVAALLGRARAAISTTAGIAEVRENWVKMQRQHLSIELIASLNAADDLERVTAALGKNLPDLGVPGCVLALYGTPEKPLATVRPVFVYREGAPPVAAADLACYPSLALAPETFLRAEAPGAALVLPLFFQESQFGFVIFPVGTWDGEIYENVRLALANNLQRLRVLRLREEARTAQERAYDEVERQVKERTRQLEIEIAERRRAEDALLQEQYLTRALMDNTPDFIYFKDDLSRYIRLNEAFARHLGLASPAAGIGKADEDFFSDAFSAKTRSDEGRVMESGRPVVGHRGARALAGRTGIVDVHRQASAPGHDGENHGHHRHLPRHHRPQAGRGRGAPPERRARGPRPGADGGARGGEPRARGILVFGLP